MPVLRISGGGSLGAVGEVQTGNSIWPWVEATAGAAAIPADWPRISIVTPNYNYGSLIEMTLRSVLMQAYPNLEYIVIDDGSADDSVAIIRKYEPRLAHFEHHPNQGQYATINKGFARATGDILGWINSDDIYLPWTLRAVARIFMQFPQVQWVTGHPCRIQEGTVHAIGKLTPYPRELLRAGLFHGGPGGLGWIQQESCFWRRDLWEKAAPLRTDLHFAADYELWTRFAQHADLYSTSTLLAGFTVRGGNNRSLANREKYLQEVAVVQKQIGEQIDPGARRSLANLRRYHLVRKMPAIRRVARMAAGLGKYHGPVLHWDFDQSRYRLESEPFFR